MKKILKWLLFIVVLFAIGIVSMAFLPHIAGTLVTITGCLVWAIGGPNVLNLI